MVIILTSEEVIQIVITHINDNVIAGGYTANGGLLKADADNELIAEIDVTEDEEDGGGRMTDYDRYLHDTLGTTVQDNEQSSHAVQATRRQCYERAQEAAQEQPERAIMPEEAQNASQVMPGAATPIMPQDNFEGFRGWIKPFEGIYPPDVAEHVRTFASEEAAQSEIESIAHSYRIIDPNAPPLFPPSMDEGQLQVRAERMGLKRVVGQYTAGDWLLAAALIAVIVGLVGAMWGGWR